MRKKFSIKGRVVALFLVFASVLGIYAVALYDLQVANRDKYTSAGRSISVSTETVKAVRGDILDRCGRVLVTNEECYNLTINMSELRKQEDTNRALLDIINFVTQEGEEYTDTFPVSKTGTKYRYLVSMTDIQQSRLSEYKKYFKLDEDISAEELMTFMAEHYDIDTSMYDREELRRIIGVRYEVEIRNIVNISPYTFASDVDSGLITKILETGMTGLDIETTWKRVYKTSYAAHILGHIGLMNEEEYEEYKDRGYAMDAYIGKDGAEKAFEEYLKGSDGTIKVGRNADGVTVAVETEVETVPGRDVMLTLDIGLQEAAEKALENCINTINSERDEDEEKATGGAAVVVQVGTGDVLASASYPSFDITAYMSDYDSLANDSSMPLYNRATMGTYSPGSTFKIVTATAALGEGVITPWTTIYDEGQFTKYSGYQPKCWIYPGSHGYEDVVDAIRDSCNYFFYVAGSETGIDSISKYAEDYGLGQTTGIEVPENTGTVASRIYKESVKNEDWYVGDTLQEQKRRTRFTATTTASASRIPKFRGIRFSRLTEARRRAS